MKREIQTLVSIIPDEDLDSVPAPFTLVSSAQVLADLSDVDLSNLPFKPFGITIHQHIISDRDEEIRISVTRDCENERGLWGTDPDTLKLHSAEFPTYEEGLQALKNAFGAKGLSFAAIVSDEDFLPEELRGKLITKSEYDRWQFKSWASKN